MIVELINTGSELMLGHTLNTHQQWLGRRLAGLGWVIDRQVAVADSGPAIQQAVRESLGRADLILVTGGLGPTSDDITRELIAELLGKPLHENAAIVAGLKSFFAERGRPMPERNRVQAQIPEGAMVLANPNGTAPGLAMKTEPNHFRADGRPSWVILLPGPPRELRPMFDDFVVPLLQREFPPQSFSHRTLRTTGIGESALAEQVAPRLQALVDAGLELGYCARTGAVDVRLSGWGEKGKRIVEEAYLIVESLVGDQVYGYDEEEIETVIVHELATRGQTLAVAESCTGGAIAHRITNVPGASVVLIAGLVTYANAAKTRFAGVQEATLQAHGAVSETVVREMAEGVRRATGADYGIGVTGIAGPGGGTPEKPAGTVFIAVSGPNGTVVEKRLNRFERVAFKEVTGLQALDLLRQQIKAQRQP